MIKPWPVSFGSWPVLALHHCLSPMLVMSDIFKFLQVYLYLHYISPAPLLDVAKMLHPQQSLLWVMHPHHEDIRNTYIYTIFRHTWGWNQNLVYWSDDLLKNVWHIFYRKGIKLIKQFDNFFLHYLYIVRSTNQFRYNYYLGSFLYEHKISIQ